MSEKEKHQLIGKQFKVLSAGSIMLVDYMGSDQAIEEAARVSYGEGTRPVSKTQTLIRYLYRHSHSTPLEMCEVKFKIKLPMDVMRQLIRHRVFSANEYSTRYSLPIDDTDITDVWRLQSTDNKQGSDGELTDWPDEYSLERQEFATPSDFLSECENGVIEHSKSFYEVAQDFGIAREVARKHLPLSTYTEIFWKGDLRGILHFMGLRCDSHAQWEIRQYANIIAGIVKELFPLSYQAWYDYQFKAQSMSRMEMQALQEIFKLAQENYDGCLAKDLAKKYNLYDDTKKSHREYDEFVAKFNGNYNDENEFELEV